MRDGKPSLPLPAQLLCASCLSAALLAGCGATPENADDETLETDPGRAPFETVPLPGGNIVGADPMALAKSLYGDSDPKEGNYSQEPELLSETAMQQVVLFTQVDLPDDSVRSLRHRLEFKPQGSDWKLIWAGKQVQCWPGRGHENWSKEPCR
ncbi:MAG: hypothetical protein LJE69_11775 [Thiohalocapsa sp.]|uniref:hypothetical protein n=1 Tax=Thiohalocapsa sp. TaxID=2497641 RepID=UPI0025CB9B45|nr:hypothetical protein [Thiohalocapsa sp.]MCG6941914.1 hypothetical protein [Thiohalocapsa sp.]